MKSFAHLKRESPFHDVFPNGMAPIKNILIPQPVKLEGSDETEAYILDVGKCTAEQKDRVAAIIAERFGASKADVLAEMEKNGMPIRASQVDGVSSDSLAFL